jgi:murein DD-endopeptidase MepM/ murein hydrolase activator NlpD
MKTKARRVRSDLTIALIVTISLIGIYHLITNINHDDNGITSPVTEMRKSVHMEKYGFSNEDYFFENSTIANNQFLGDILYKSGIPYPLIAELEQKAKEVYDVRRIRVGKDYSIVREDSCGTAVALVYEPDPLSYVVFDFRDSVSVRNVEREYLTCVETASGKLQTSLWDALVGQGYDFALVDLMEDALASSVSFYHAKKGDEFKLIYERKYIDDRPIALGQLLGAYYKNSRGEHYAIYFESDKYSGFFDQEARPSKKSFLLSPVKYSRISSPFSYNRFHPIKKRKIPHLGTDYAALHGTPIRTVADGVVISASYTKANGKYVKIKHDKTYQTQYLHMSRFAKGIVPGATVKRGETIGYVGSTGLATGPHVCFRFWKNGRQVNHLRENFPPADPMPEEYLPSFYDKRDEIVNFLSHITIDEPRPKAKAVSLEQPNT